MSNLPLLVMGDGILHESLAGKDSAKIILRAVRPSCIDVGEADIAIEHSV